VQVILTADIAETVHIDPALKCSMGRGGFQRTIFSSMFDAEVECAVRELDWSLGDKPMVVGDGDFYCSGRDVIVACGVASQDSCG
jgi:hypothetical protein